MEFENVKLPWLPESECYLMDLYKNGMTLEPHVESLIARYKGWCFELGAGYGLNCYSLDNPDSYYSVEQESEKFKFLKLNSKNRCTREVKYLPKLDGDKPLTFLICNKLLYIDQLWIQRPDIVDYIIKAKVPILITIQKREIVNWQESFMWQLMKDKYYCTRMSGDQYLFRSADSIRTSDHSCQPESH